MHWVGRNKMRFDSRFKSVHSKYRKPIRNEGSKLDRWLPRLSHFSQFGLFLFTVGTIYFTVVPLYQKALLEESIAKKEVDLKLATQVLAANEIALHSAKRDLNATVMALRTAQAALSLAELKTYSQKRQYEVDAFVRSIGFNCSGLSRRPLPLDLTTINDKSHRSEPFEETFKVNPKECLISGFRSSRFRKSLQKPDFLFLEARISDLGDRLLQLKARAMKDVAELPERAKTDRNVLLPATGFEVQVEALFVKTPLSIYSPSKEAKFARDVVRNQNRIASEYEAALRKVVTTLAKIEWPIRSP